jgi:hypothetical protein
MIEAEFLLAAQIVMIYCPRSLCLYDCLYICISQVQFLILSYYRIRFLILST